MKPTRKEIIEAIKVLQAAMSELKDTELVVSSAFLRVLPDDDEYDMRSPVEAVRCIEAVAFLQSISGRE